MTGISLIIAFVVMVVVMILAISKWKIHPFLAIMGVSLILALLAIPLTSIPGVIGAGFSGTFSSLGIVIILGAMIGFFLEKTGAALTMADAVVRRIGKKHPELAILIMGWIVSIPVFCDSGFVILNPIRKAITKKTGVSGVAMAVALSAGLYTSHVFIPPTPGPIAAANSLGLDGHMLLVIGIGALVSIPVLIVSYFFAKFIGKKVASADDAANDETVKSYDELVKEYGKLPNVFLSFAPIVVPILLMAIKSIVDMTGGAGLFADLLKFLGTPMISLAVGLIISIGTLAVTGKMDQFRSLSDETLRTVGPILFVTAARRRAGQGDFGSGHRSLHHRKRGFPQRRRYLLPVPDRRNSKNGAGLLHGSHHHHGGYHGRVLGGRRADGRAWSNLSACRRAHRHGDWRGRDDRIPRKRFLLLGRHRVWRHEGSGRI